MVLVRFAVCQQMSLQVWPLVKALVAHGAFVRRFFHMQDFVHGQGSWLAKSFSTFCALEWLFLWMDIPGNNGKRKLYSSDFQLRGEKTTKHSEWRHPNRSLRLNTGLRALLQTFGIKIETILNYRHIRRLKYIEFNLKKVCLVKVKKYNL